jgi:hypothetical protein
MQNLDESKTAATWSSLTGEIYVPQYEAKYQRLSQRTRWHS